MYTKLRFLVFFDLVKKSVRHKNISSLFLQDSGFKWNKTYFLNGPGPIVSVDFLRTLFSIFFAGGLVFGIVNIVGNFGTVFCDQAYWQSSVAAKPLQVIPT